MIFGTGIDLAEIRRFEKWINDSGFTDKYFAPEEMAYIRSRGKGAVNSLAAGYAAKEALCKALGSGFDGLPLKEITVLRDEKGKPGFRLGSEVQRRVEACGKNPVVHLSLSHEAGLAVAQVIIEVDNG
ncbi:holo-ACP synthase [Spirochaeta isovalerica]|uniref:Holo-[acyl-carrier-protein] synthase n=1 Tax=Spirochaeta isovalerica TaxID=150 RepID=A0A841RA68_9SPIO|nr:holo-[acyl-carrier protein] synthase [Spirochaeta isovalerica]